jgi:hypothetical protein
MGGKVCEVVFVDWALPRKEEAGHLLSKEEASRWEV